MLLTLNDVFNPDLTERLRSLLTAGAAASTHEAASIVRDSLIAHPLFVLGVQPRSLSEPSFTYGEEGMESKPGVAPAMQGELRADLSVTVFLSDPASYDGGELVVDTGYGDESYKERMGSCVVHSASARHHMARITRGTRLTCQLWAQSLIRDPAQREILYDVGYSLHLLELFRGDKSADVERLRKCQENLLRLWSEP